MNAAQLHLMVNHVPVLGMILAIPVLLLARTKIGGRGAALAAAMLILIGSLGSIISVVTGENAHHFLEEYTGMHSEQTEVHEERAEVANVAAILTGVVGILFLLMSLRKEKSAPVWAWTTMMVFLLITSLLMGWAAHAGGQIRHTEIRPGWKDAPNVSASETMKSVQSKLGDLIKSGTATFDQKLGVLKENLEDGSASSRELVQDIESAVKNAGDKSDELLLEIDSAIRGARKSGANVADAVHEAIEEFDEHTH